MNQPGESIRVLHVDDEPDLAELTGRMLKRDSDRFTVVTATSAEDGLERLREDEFDCVISDYDMPGQNGLEFLDSVRAEYPDLPFILFTGKGSEEVAGDAISAGVTDYLQKGPGGEQYELLANRVKNSVDQYRAEMAIEETRERFQTLVEETTDVTLIVAPDGTITYATPSADRVLGRSPDDLVDSDGFAPVHPEDREHVMAAFGQLVENPTQRQTTEFRYEKPDGSYIWVEARGRNLLDDPVIEGLVVYVRETTERKERELELGRKERRFQAIFNDPNILVGMIDLDGAVLDINQTALEYIDAEIDEVVGKPFWKTPWFDHSSSVQADVREWIERAADGEYVEFEVDLLRQNDEPYTIQGVFRPVRDDEGEVVSLIISDREITEQKERERELERIRDFFTEAERLGNLGAWEFDSSGEVVWTRGTRRIHEVDDTYEPTIESGLEFLHPDDRPAIRQEIHEALEAGEPYDVQARLVTREGEERWVRTRGKPVGDESETVRGYIQDITEQKERERDLEGAKTQLEAAVEAGAVGTWEWHIPENTLVAGREFARKFGVDPTEARAGVPLDRFVSSIHDRDRIEQRIDEAVDACGEYEEEYRVWDADDELRWVVARGRVVCDADGTPQRFPGALIDITERKNAERELQRQKEELDAFARVVSHDLRNPLDVAQGRLQLAQEDCENEHLEAIGRSHERMQELIDDLLVLSRDSEPLTEVTAVDLAALAADCWDNVETERASLVTDTTREVYGDRRRLRHLFENLFRNAVEHGSTNSRSSSPPEDAAEANSSEPSVADEQRSSSPASHTRQDADAPEDAVEDDGEAVTVTVGDVDGGFYVEDDGPGIPREERESVFEAGYSTGNDGTGFGLSIVKRVVDAHEWRVRVADGTDGGARFEITDV